MKYEGKIEKLNKIVVTDPTYDKDVWCRYEKDNINGENWNVSLFIDTVNNTVDNMSFNTIDFRILLTKDPYVAKLQNDRLFHMKDINTNNFEIGMDSACIAFGINDIAQKIIESKDIWQPDCALRTLTDGMFGNVIEGTNDNDLQFICIDGYFDDDTGFTESDILNYIVNNFEISELKELGKDIEL